MKSHSIKSVAGKMKKYIPLAVALICVVATLMVRLAIPVMAIGTSEKSSSAAYKDGYFYFKIVDDAGLTSQMKINFSRNSAPSYSDMLNKATTYNCSIAPSEWSANNHNVTLNQTTVTTQKANSDNYTALVLSISYTQHAHYQSSGFVYDRPDNCGGRFNLNDLNGNSTVVGGFVNEDTTRTVTLQIYAGLTGLVTWDSGGKHYRTNGTQMTLNYTRPTYSATFNGNGNSGGATDTQWRLRGDNFNLDNGFWRDGHNFSHWTDQYGAVYYHGWTRVADQNMTFTAQWAPWQHTVTYNANGGTGAPGNQTKTTGSVLTLSSATPSKTGYTFAGWSCSAGGTYSAGSQYTRDQDSGTVTMTAQWTANKYTVTYNSNGGSGSMSADTATYDSNYTTKANSFTRTGYTFTGWNEKADGTGTSWTSYIGKPWKWKYTKSITLYAQWKANTYTVTYNANGGSGTMSSDTATYDANYTTKANGFTKTGYEFVGWNEKADGSGTSWTSYIGKPWKWTYTNNVTLYAQWKASNYTIKFDANGGTGSMGNQTATYDTALNLSANRFARPTYTFLGWSKDKDAATASYSNSQSVKNIGSAGTTVTLYAVWRKTDASFDTSTLIHDENMFTGDGKIVGGAGTTYDKNNVDSKYAHVDNASNPGYFTRR